MNILLLGFMGSGKTGVGNVVARKLGYKFIEMDKLILEHTGFNSINEVYEHKLSLWKESELELSKELSIQDKQVIATGGGFVENELNKIYFDESSIESRFFYLDTKAEVITERIVDKIEHEQGNNTKNQNDSIHEKKVKQTLKRIQKLLPKRDHLYRNQADWVINTYNKSQDKIAELIFKSINIDFHTPKTLHNYEKLLLLSLDQDTHDIYELAHNFISYILIETILLDLLFRDKLEVSDNQMTINDNKYEHSDKIISHVINEIKNMDKKESLGIQIQRILQQDSKVIVENVITNMVNKNILTSESEKFLIFFANDLYEPTDKFLKKEIMEDILNLENDIETAILILMLEKINILKIIVGNKSIELLEKAQNLLQDTKYFEKMKLLDKGVKFASVSFASSL